MAQVKGGDPDTTMTVVVGIAGVIVVLLTIILLQALYLQTESDLYAEVYREPLLDVVQVRAQQQELINGYLWVDRGLGIVRIPIDRAMELLAREAGAGPPAAAPPPAGR